MSRRIALEQICVEVNGVERVRRAVSEAFPVEAEEALEELIAAYGTPSVFVSSALIVRPLGRQHWAIIRVGHSGPSLDSSLGFRALLATNREWKRGLDPFHLDDRHPPDWTLRGTVSAIDYEVEIAAPTLAATFESLKTHGSPLMLGATQVLIDGGKFVLPATEPQNAMFRAIWTMQPYASRIEFSFATFAFGPNLGVNAVAMPDPPAILPAGALNSEQVQDYPEGRYELAMQLAIEGQHQEEFDWLLRRKSSKQVLWTALLLIVAMTAALLLSKLL